MENAWDTLVNYEVNLILTRSADYVISSATGKLKFAITPTKLFSFFIVTLLTRDNPKIKQQLQIRFKKTIN